MQNVFAVGFVHSQGVWLCITCLTRRGSTTSLEHLERCGFVVNCCSPQPFPPSAVEQKAMVNVELDALCFQGQKTGAFQKAVSSQITTPFFRALE